MPSSSSVTSRRTTPRRREAFVPNVCVIDPNPSDFAEWQPEIESKGGRIHHVGSAAEALRLARRESIDLWVVNAELPGLSGCEFCGMLRAAGNTTPIYLVADSYSAELERAAWRARATLFGCKPGHHQWLDHWLDSNPTANRSRSAPSSPSVR